MLMNLFSQKCPNPECGREVTRQAQYCPYCGQPLKSGVVVCGKCRAENPADARFCHACGELLSESAAPAIHQQVWRRSAEDFAARVEVEDLNGLLKKGLQIDPGCNALLVHQGKAVATVAPGAYTLETIPQHVTNWLRSLVGGVPQRLTALLVEVTPTELEFYLGGSYTKDDLPLGIKLRLQVEVGDPGRFLVNLLKAQQRYSKEQLRQYLYPEIVQILDRWLRTHTLEELTTDYALRQKIELDLEESLRQTFAQSGLKFLMARTVELNLEPYDHIRGVRGKYALQIAEFQADAQGKRALYEVESGAEIDLEQARLKASQRLLELKKQIDLLELAEETRKVEQEEKKADLYARLMAAIQQNQMAEVRSQAEFEAFLDQIDRQKLLREKERAELLRTWQEDGEDHELARRHLLARLEIERQSELKLAALKLERDLAEQKLDAEIELARKTAEFKWSMERRQVQEELENERARAEIELQRTRVQIEIEALQRQSEREDALLGIELLAKMKELQRLDEEQKRRIEREDFLARQRATMELEIQRFELQERARQAEREHELARIRELSQVSVEHLIVLSPPEQAQVLAELRRTETLKGMSEEQILALAAERSPEVARAFQEKYRALANREADLRERELYERLLGENKETLRQLQIEADKSAQRIQEMANHALDRMAETAQAYAKSSTQTPPIIITAGSSPPSVYPPSSAISESKTAEMKVCLKCGRYSEAQARFCVYCGKPFEGV
jgi:ribosomal protein L40E